ncbi:MAG: 50S ribosomal protein L23 [Coriobacteriia bacterium]|nr:50S ribosomal protein L23 [Coriobacteriia bacterium]MBS5478200.1 50S ribosomal protein L23 [Coriobacteriia bacterium]
MNTFDPRTIIIRPIVSEASFDKMEQNKYTFEVARDADKPAIKRAIEDIFNVHVKSVNTLWVKAKPKRVRVQSGYTRTWKKAVVTIADGETIEIFGKQA